VPVLALALAWVPALALEPGLVPVRHSL